MFEWLFGKNPKTPEPQVKENEDGSVSTSYEFSLDGDNMRPVRDDVVSIFDDKLGEHGPVMHAMDPTRIMNFEGGGPPVWSVAYTRVDGPKPYWLLMTYGFSHTLTPLPLREGYTHEYSLAVPADGDTPPVWAPAILRHLSRYVLQSGAELQVGDNMPLHAPITCSPFPPQHHAQMEQTPINTVVLGVDPVLSPILTNHGTVEVRRIVGINSEELEQITAWNCTAFLEEWMRDDARLVTDIRRPTLLEGAFAARCKSRAEEEGSSCGMLFIEAGWLETDEGLEVHFPGGHQARQTLEVIRARIPFNRALFLRGPPGAPPIKFDPQPEFGLHIEEGQLLVISGNLNDPIFQSVVNKIEPDSAGTKIVFGKG